MFSNSSRLPSNVSYHQIANINDDTFLFCFDFPKLDFDFCCGCSLRSGVLFLGIFFYCLWSWFSIKYIKSWDNF